MTRTSDLLKGVALPLALAILTVSCASGSSERYETSIGCVGEPNEPPAPTMISPASGATGVPVNLGTIYFGPAPSGQAYYALLLVTGSSIKGGPLVAAQTPLPSGAEGAVLQASIPVLAPDTVYTVQAVDTSTTNSCYEQLPVSFTTQ